MLRDLGGYRAELWKSFEADGLTVDFVGSTTGPDSPAIKTMKAIPVRQSIGLTISGWLNIYTPDIVTLIIGTNDTKDIIHFQQLPDAQLLVASIPLD